MSLDKLEDSSSLKNTFDRQYILRISLVVIVVAGLLIGGVMYVSNSEEEPTGEESFDLQYTESGVIITQTEGEPVKDNAQIRFNYYDGETSVHNISVTSLSQSQIVTTNRDVYEMEFVEVEWVYDKLDTETIYTEPIPEKYQADPPNVEVPDLNVRTMELEQLNAQEYISSESEITDYQWSITGVSDKTGQIVDLQFSEPGTYSADLTVTDELGNEVTDSFVLTVNSPELIVNASVPNKVPLDETVSLDATDFTSAQATSFSWEIEGIEYNSPAVSHKFTDAGVSEVKLTVSDSFGYQEQRNYEVIVTENKQIDISVESNSDGSVVFSSSLEEDIVSYQWTFGDGQTETTTDSVVDHKYESSGSYTVTVVATTTSGNTVVDTLNINVDNASGEDDNESDDSTEDTVQIAIQSNSDSSWSVQSVSGASTDEVLPSNNIGDENPTIHLVEGQRYTFTGLNGSHPLEFRDLFGDVLLSQEVSTPYEDSEAINWVDNGNSVSFTVAPSISSSLEGYQSYNNRTEMDGDILVVSD